MDRDVIVDVWSLFDHGPRTLQLLEELIFTLLQLSLVVDVDEVGTHGFRVPFSPAKFLVRRVPVRFNPVIAAWLLKHR